MTDAGNLAIFKTADKHDIGDKVRRLYDLAKEFEGLANELSEYGFVTPDIYIAPFGHTQTASGGIFVNDAFSAYSEAVFLEEETI